MADSGQPSTAGDPPTPTTDTSLFPAGNDQQQRLSRAGASSAGFLASPVQTTFGRLSEERVGDLGMTTALRRNSSGSPTPSPTSAGAAFVQDGARAPSEMLRRRSRSHSGDVEVHAAASPKLPLGVRRAEQGWGGHASPLDAPQGWSLTDVRAGVSLSPQPPSQSHPLEFHNPFGPSTSTLSFAPSAALDTTYSSSDSEDEGDRTARPVDQEEHQARSPLKPSSDWPSSQRSPAGPTEPHPFRLPSSSSSRYPQGPSRRSTLRAVGRSIRRASLRVVNLADGDDEDDARSHQMLNGGDEEDRVDMESVNDGEKEFRDRRAREERPLRGKSLRIFGPESPFRRTCAAFLSWTYLEPAILGLILLAAVVFAIQSAPNVYQHPRSSGFTQWTHYVLLCIYSVFTIEIGARIIAHGLWFNPPSPSSTTLSSQPPSIHPHNASVTSLISQEPSVGLGLGPGLAAAASISMLPASPLTQMHHAAPFALAIHRQRRTHQQAFLRHSFNRIDLIAVLSFWVAFGLRVGGGPLSAIRVFEGLSVLRCVRLLGITAGTNTILQSLKASAPGLIDLGIFVTFALVLFSIVGVQSFSGSMKRYCQWQDPAGILPPVKSSQHCGGFSLQNGTVVGYNFREDGIAFQAEAAKGFICEWPSTCAELSNPSSFKNYDNVFSSLYLSVVLSSVNTYTDLEYSIMDSESFAAALFFVVGVIILNLWLLNLTTAVVTSCFAEIRLLKHSAFAAGAVVQSTAATVSRGSSRALGRTSSVLRRAFGSTAVRLLWTTLALVSMVLLSLDDTPGIQNALLGIAIAFDVEIALRFFASLPDWRAFWRSPTNAVDLLLSVGSTVQQFHSVASPWLAVFTCMRFYRVVLAVPRLRRLLLKLGSIFGALLNVVLFVLGMTFLISLVAVQLFRGIPDASNEMTFYTTWNSFLATYQVLSSENWTDVVSNLSGQPPIPLIISIVFLCAWMVFGYYLIMGSLFVAAINEAFVIPEEDKRRLQLEAYLHQGEIAPAGVVTWLNSRFNPYQENSPTLSVVGRALHLFRKKQAHEDIELVEQDPPPESRRVFTSEDLSATHRRQASRQQERERRAQLHDFIAQHPSFNRSLFILGPANPLRRACQALVAPSDNGDRLDGRPANKRLRWTFSAFITVTVLTSLVVAAIDTPLHRLKAYLSDTDGDPLQRWTWCTITDLAIGVVFIVEAFIKIIADGFVFSPDAAYLPSNGVDLIVLVAYIVNVESVLVGDSTRFTRALKAFRALRLINLFPRMRQTFHHVVIAGAVDLLDASALAVLYLIPFATWGQQLFSGLLYTCSDSSVKTMAECVGEYIASPVSDWGILQPRVWSNPKWSFDSFRSSMLILFEIVSLEGWIDVLGSVMNIADPDAQPQQNSSPENAIFLVIFQLLGAAFILTLFVSLILSGVARRSGAALLTQEQMHWIDLQKLIHRQKHTRAPKDRPSSAVRAWCFNRATDKKGWWTRVYGAPLYCLHLVVLATSGAGGDDGDIIRNYIFLALTLIFLLDLVVRLIGLGWSFLLAGWNLFDLASIIGVAATTLPVLLTQQDEVLPGIGYEVASQLQKLFLVGVAFKLVQKVDKLNRFFKVAAASLPSLFNILGLWLISFGFFAIVYMEVFGLTRWGTVGTSNKNYSSPFRALLLLALASTGEGWNQFMHDYGRHEFPRCTESDNYLLSDCGSSPWALALFSAWNITSMYIFTSLVLATVIEAFSSFTSSSKGEHTITRDQWRSFKRAWHTVDTQRTGWIAPEDVGKLFSRLDGIFEAKVYPAEWSIAALKKRSAEVDGAIDPRKLSSVVGEIDETAVNRRRRAFDLLYNETMMVTEESGGRLAFTSALILIAQHKIIDIDRALLFEDLVERRQRLARVQDRIRYKKVLGRLNVLILRRRFLAVRKTRPPPPVTRATRPTLTINISTPAERPSIVIDQSSPPPSPTGIPHTESPSSFTPPKQDSATL